MWLCVFYLKFRPYRTQGIVLKLVCYLKFRPYRTQPIFTIWLFFTPKNRRFLAISAKLLILYMVVIQ
ncbi:MAG: hypothetical protein RBR69_04275, partial [Candidatus Cloacimonadaceae bacterium]|nr:hypothetical protein [Candidatus Cloacimonadaceae bacterium]